MKRSLVRYAYWIQPPSQDMVEFTNLYDEIANQRTRDREQASVEYKNAKQLAHADFVACSLSLAEFKAEKARALERHTRLVAAADCCFRECCALSAVRSDMHSTLWTQRLDFVVKARPVYDQYYAEARRRDELKDVCDCEYTPNAMRKSQINTAGLYMYRARTCATECIRLAHDRIWLQRVLHYYALYDEIAAECIANWNAEREPARHLINEIRAKYHLEPICSQPCHE